jgi:hypothetical protein
MASAAAGSASWRFDAMIRYELAEEILALLRTDSGRRLRQAQARDPGDPAEVAQLTKAHALYTELRASVHRRSAEEIDTIISEYGPLARSVTGAIAP